MSSHDKLQKFANDHGIVLKLDGEVGFGRPCVGFMHGNSYVAFNPLVFPDFDRAPGFEDDSILDCAPPDAYGKHDCLAVLIHGDSRDAAIEQLSKWVDDMNELGVEVVDYATGATGIQAAITGLIGKAIRKKAR